MATVPSAIRGLTILGGFIRERYREAQRFVFHFKRIIACATNRYDTRYRNQRGPSPVGVCLLKCGTFRYRSCVVDWVSSHDVLVVWCTHLASNVHVRLHRKISCRLEFLVVGHNTTKECRSVLFGPCVPGNLIERSTAVFELAW